MWRGLYQTRASVDRLMMPWIPISNKYEATPAAGRRDSRLDCSLHDDCSCGRLQRRPGAPTSAGLATFVAIMLSAISIVPTPDLSTGDDGPRAKNRTEVAGRCSTTAAVRECRSSRDDTIIRQFCSLTGGRDLEDLQPLCQEGCAD